MALLAEGTQPTVLDFGGGASAAAASQVPRFETWSVLARLDDLDALTDEATAAGREDRADRSNRTDLVDEDVTHVPQAGQPTRLTAPEPRDVALHRGEDAAFLPGIAAGFPEGYEELDHRVRVRQWVCHGKLVTQGCHVRSRPCRAA